MSPEYYRRREQDEARARLARTLVAYAFGVAEADMDALTRRNARVAFGRQIAMYLAHISFELSLSRVAMAFGRDRTTVSHACHLVEDRRDDPEFDAKLEDLESLLRAAPAPATAAQGA
ncbi:MAG: chromosomal replication initiator DnaA [Robiginitomaculum sp.]|nr:MAG: chromosomal replication initiator DnaA [Robiginitomaculum sp.]